MKVLLIHTNREHGPQPVIPMGLCLVASSLQAHGFRPRILDLCFSRCPEREIRNVICEWQPDAIGMSIRNLDSGEYLQTRLYLPQIIEMAKTCRQYSNAPFLIGGPAVSVAPNEMLELFNADYAIVGDGEGVMVELLQRLQQNKPTDDIPGVYSQAQPETRNPEPFDFAQGKPGTSYARVNDLRSLPSPELGNWLDMRRYARAGAYCPIQSKRGCGFQCIYCTYRFIEGAQYRLREPDAVAEEIETGIKQWGARHFEFVDATFNHPHDYAVAVCEAIIRRDLKAELHSTGINPIAASPELMKLMYRAGFRSILCSPDSASDTMLQNLQRGFAVEHIERTATWAREAGLSVLWSFLFGGPGENEKTIQETLQFMDRVLQSQDRIICTVGLRVYPRTRLEHIAREEGILTTDQNLIDPAFYFSPQITPERILEMLEKSSRRSQMIYLGAITSPLITFALRMHTKLRLPGPSWSAVPIYNFMKSILKLK